MFPVLAALFSIAIFILHLCIFVLIWSVLCSYPVNTDFNNKAMRL